MHITILDLICNGPTARFFAEQAFGNRLFFLGYNWDTAVLV